MQTEAKLTSPHRSRQPFHQAVDDYYKQKDKYETLAAEQKDEVEPESQQDYTLKNQLKELRRFLPEDLKNQSDKVQQEQNKTKDLPIMPVHPAEENTTGNLTDMVAKESKDSTASSHPNHQEETGATSGGAQSKATVMDHQSKGPAVPENMPGQEGSKDDRKAQAEAMNK